MINEDHQRDTRFVHAGKDRDPHTGASSIPIYQASTFAQPDPDHPGKYDYGRSGNMTREALEEAIAQMEGGTRGFAFASGMAAITAALLLFKPGDHIIACEDIYGGTYRVLTTLFTQWGLETSFVDTTDPEKVAAAVKANTRALFIETPSNPLLKITDLKAMARLASARGLVSIIDNTFPTPYLQRPIEQGFDIVLHSATKFISGHSDVIAGLAVTHNDELGRRMKMVQNNGGAVLGPMDSWLVLRGARTLGVRMNQMQASAGIVARGLRKFPAVMKVYYPGLEDHPGHAIDAGQSAGPGAVLSFELPDKEMAKKVFANVKLCLPAVSLGGVESILSWPARMSHAAMPSDERCRRGIKDGLLRLSVGLEAPQDILADLDRALK